jgi:hypothetical protein
MRVRVECGSESTAAAGPLRFYLGEQLRTVEEVIDKWYGRDDTFFKVRADDGDLYILRESPSSAESEWSLESSRELKRP